MDSSPTFRGRLRRRGVSSREGFLCGISIFMLGSPISPIRRRASSIPSRRCWPGWTRPEPWATISPYTSSSPWWECISSCGPWVPRRPAPSSAGLHMVFPRSSTAAWDNLPSSRLRPGFPSSSMHMRERAQARGRERFFSPSFLL